MPQLKILVSGGGIGGNALAFFLSKLGHTITVIERFPSLRDTGLQIDLRGHGIQVLKKTGLEAKFRALSAPEQGLQIVNSKGTQRAFFPANTSGKGLQNFTTEYEIMRGDLCRLFYEETKDKVEYVFGATVEKFEDDGEGVGVKFSNGQTGRYDLLVGADGVGSRTRRMMLGGEKDAFYRIENLSTAYFTIPWAMAPGEGYIATTYVATGGRAIMTRRKCPDTIQVYLFGTEKSEELDQARPGDVEKEKRYFADMYREAGWRAEGIVKLMMEECDDFYCERMGVVKMDSWSKGRVTLVGDAGYCPSGTTGMGTTSAIVGAYILAGEIAARYPTTTNKEEKEEGMNSQESSRASLAAALKDYEDKFRPFMNQVQAGVLEGASSWRMPSSGWGVALFNFGLGVAARLRVNILGEMFLKEKIKDWELPVYEELERVLAESPLRSQK